MAPPRVLRAALWCTAGLILLGAAAWGCIYRYGYGEKYRVERDNLTSYWARAKTSEWIPGPPYLVVRPDGHILGAESPTPPGPSAAPFTGSFTATIREVGEVFCRTPEDAIELARSLNYSWKHGVLTAHREGDYFVVYREPEADGLVRGKTLNVRIGTNHCTVDRWTAFRCRKPPAVGIDRPEIISIRP